MSQDQVDIKSQQPEVAISHSQQWLHECTLVTRVNDQATLGDARTGDVVAKKSGNRVNATVQTPDGVTGYCAPWY